jgi:competence protein ComEC
MRRNAGRFLLGLLSVVLFAGADAPEPKGLEIYFIDVMGGAATLVVTPERETILLDTGWPGLNDRDPKRIEYVLRNVAKLQKTDHYGGVEGLARRVKVVKYWDRGLPDLSKPDQDKANFPDGPRANDPLGIAYLKASEGKRATLKAGDRLPLKGEIEALVLAASGQVESTSGGRPNPRLCERPRPISRLTPATTPGASPSGSALVTLDSSTAAI